MSPIVLSLFLGLAGASPGSETWERICRPAPADSARPGLMECPRLKTSSTRILLHMERDARGMRRSEWSAEKGLDAVHVPDETFWRILDELAGPGGEWVERDPSTLGTDSLRFEARVGQSFECRNCPGDWLAGTWGPFGASRLLVVRRDVPAAPATRTLTLTPGADISTSALTLRSSQPCRNATGTCIETRTGPGNTSWTLERLDPKSGWTRVRIEWESQPLGDSLSLDTLRQDLPAAELRLLLRNWLDAETDLFAANVLLPAAPLFSVSATDWRRRALPGFRLAAILRELETAPRFPDTLLLYQDQNGSAGIRGKLRWMELSR